MENEITAPNGPVDIDNGSVEALGSGLRSLRGGLSLRELAKELSSSKSVLGRVENGEQLPSAELCKQYETYFGLPAGILKAERDRILRGEWPAQEIPSRRRESALPLRNPARPSANATTLALGIVLVLAFLSLSFVKGDEASACTSIGTLDPGLHEELANPADVGARLERLSQQLPARADTCAADGAYMWQALVVQELMDGQKPNGALLVDPVGTDIYLNRSAWGSYRQIGGRSGSMAQAVGGLPLEIVELGDHVEIRLSAGTVLVAEQSEAPYFWIPGEYVLWWRDNLARLGRPTSNPLSASLHQEFENGVARVSTSDPGTPSLSLIGNPYSELPELGKIRERIVRQTDGTAWYVTPDDHRLWIPDGATWDCLGGADRAWPHDLPSYAIASLSYGGLAHC